MNIAGVLVHAKPGFANEVRADLLEILGVEIHQETDDGRFVVTVEDVDGSDPGSSVLAIHKLGGVLSASLAFHHFEEDGDNQSGSAKPSKGGLRT